MTRLEDLLNSLTTVLIRYHDAQGIKILITEADPILRQKKSRQEAIRILKNTEPKFDERLTKLNEECTGKYTERAPFLHYILNEITYLKSMSERKNSFTPEGLEDYKNQLAQMLIDFKNLLLTVKGSNYKVTYSTTNQMISLSGLENNAYYGNKLCKSGDLLVEEIFNRLNISTTTSDEEIRELAADICITHQNALLVPELLEMKAQLTESTLIQKARIESLELSEKDLTQRVVNQKERIEALEHTEPSPSIVLDTYATMKQSLILALKEAESRISYMEETIEKQKDTISKLESDLNKASIRTTSRYPYNPGFFGLGFGGGFAQAYAKAADHAEHQSEEESSISKPFSFE